MNWHRKITFQQVITQLFEEFPALRQIYQMLATTNGPTSNIVAFASVVGLNSIHLLS
jgi:hypothetical protein